MIQTSKSTQATAYANIALIKYWGKRDPVLNLPAVGSISLTLNALKTETTFRFNEKLKQDQLVINEKKASEGQRKRIENFIDIIREKAGQEVYADISSINNFPTGAGLASSASAFAALALASTHALEMDLSKQELSELARRGSGSAARSIFGGIVEMQKGSDPEGRGDFAVQIASKEYWDLRVIILITSKKEKKIGSTDAMNLTARTSPYYDSWIKSSDQDLSEMRSAINKKDIEMMGELAEYSALKMHALMFSANPHIIYWNQTTLQLIEETKVLRKKGIPAYFTIDAGPQVKILTLGKYENVITSHLGSFPGVENCIASELGSDASLVGENR